MPEISTCSTSNRDDLMCLDPGGDPPATASVAAPTSAAASAPQDSCYACVDVVPEPAGAAVSGLVAQHGRVDFALGHPSEGPFQADVASGYVQSNNDGAGLEATALRVGVSGPVKVNIDLLGAGADAGFHNVDGSTGYHAGAHATVGYGEVTANAGGAWSFTVGGGVGAEVGASFGFRDIDGDGRPEACARVSLEATVGVCFEPADITDLAD
ncbi:MAG TPA: hypothetical protein VGI10_21850 [Polyangiaceae bacterium]|jgi:hypothetical protein